MIVSEATNEKYKLKKSGPINSESVTISDLNNLGLSKLISDADLETFYTSKDDNCYVGFDFGLGRKAELHSLRYFLSVKSESEKFLGSEI
jgi:hypothetical protein